jgi:hypothetical protein
MRKIEFGGVYTVGCDFSLPPGTMIVSYDLYQEIVKQSNQGVTVNGEVIREKQKQLPQPILELEGK